MRIVTNKELSNYKVLPFDLYTENKGKILEAGEVLTPGKLIMLKNYIKVYTEEYATEKENYNSEYENESLKASNFINFSYESLDATDFETVINKDGYVKMETQVKIKYFYKRILDLLLQGYYEEGLLKLNSLVGIIKTEIYKPLLKSSRGSQLRFLGEYELCHPLNVAITSGLIAQKLEFSTMAVDQVILSALLHDIGKAVDHEIEGSHVTIGADIAKKYKENKEVVHAIMAHHGDVDANTLIAQLVQAADAISAARPGARRENLESYIKRLQKLEEIANEFEGVEKSFAIQAGREIRIMVKPEVINDDGMIIVAKEIVKRIETELEYPGQIKISLIRETRAVDYAK